MSKVMQVVLRFGPLLAAFALGLAAVLEQFFPGYSGIVTSVFSTLGLVGVKADQDVLEGVSTFAAGVVALIGVGRKLFSLLKTKATGK